MSSSVIYVSVILHFDIRIHQDECAIVIYETYRSPSSSSKVIHTIVIIIIKFRIKSGMNSDTIICKFSHYGLLFPQKLTIVVIHP